MSMKLYIRNLFHEDNPEHETIPYAYWYDHRPTPVEPEKYIIGQLGSGILTCSFIDEGATPQHGHTINTEFCWNFSRASSSAEVRSTGLLAPEHLDGFIDFTVNNNLHLVNILSPRQHAA